jgi:spore coat protein U-like protein
MRAMLWGLALATLAIPAVAAGQATDLDVMAEIVPGCAVDGSTAASGLDFGSLAFGTYPAVLAGPVDASLSASGGVQVRCTAGLTFQLSADGGEHADGSGRRLARAGDPASVVPYALYATAAHDVGLPIAGHVDVTVPASGLVDLPIYAVATLPGSVAPGLYSDTLHVTLSW